MDVTADLNFNLKKCKPKINSQIIWEFILGLSSNLYPILKDKYHVNHSDIHLSVWNSFSYGKNYSQLVLDKKESMFWFDYLD